MKSRIVLVFFIFLTVWGSLLTKGFFLQVLPNDKLEKLQKRQFEKIVTLKPRRGAVLDRNDKELAVSIASHSLFVDPKLVKHPREVAKKLSRYLNIPYRSLYKNILKKDKRFTWVKRQLSKEQMVEIRSWNYTGLGFIEEPQRVYPNRRLLGQFLGFVGRDGNGLEGLEFKFNDILKGKKRQIHLQRDAHGRPLIISGQMFTNYPDGSDVQLTIDASLQHFLEKELEFAVDKHDADSAVGVVVDVESSEILAMANVPLFNPNDPGLYAREFRRNKTVVDAFEPGSTLKTFVVATALKNKTVKPNSKFFCEEGEFKIGRRTIRDANHKFGWLSVSEILAQSSNIGMAKLGLEMGDKALRKGLLDFGFGKETGIQFPGESTGIVNTLPWNPHLVSNVSFGHGIAVTPLQISMAYSAIANGGVLYKPVVVKKVINEMNREVREFKAQRVRRVLTRGEADLMKLMLMSATAENATGFKARVSGFPVAGKTGTAQKVDLQKGGYLNGSYISSFAGFLPANHPKFVIYIAVDNPRNEYYGSQVAAPVFSKVAGYLVRKEGVEPILISKQDVIKKTVPMLKASQPLAVAQSIKDTHKVPKLEGLSLREVYHKLHGTGIEVKIRGSGLVAKVWPSSGQTLPKDKTINILLKPIHNQNH